jgi:hypothetical protein
MTQEKSKTIIKEKSSQGASCLKCADSIIQSGRSGNQLFCRVNKKKCEIANVRLYGCSCRGGAGGFPHTRETEGRASPPVVSPGGKPVFPHDSGVDYLDENISDEIASPLLVNNGHSGTFNTGKAPWTRKQKRTYRNLISWMSLKRGQGYQLFRVDLTSILGGGEYLTDNFKALRRDVENTFHYQLEYFKIETIEGNGVLHMIWAIKCDRPVWIPQKWLSRTWEKISGASVVWICRLGSSRDKSTGMRYKKRTDSEHIKKIAGYLAGQYLLVKMLSLASRGHGGVMGCRLFVHGSNSLVYFSVAYSKKVLVSSMIN